MPIDVNEVDFESQLNDSRPVLVDFWAAWCGPCRAQAPILEKLDESKVKVIKVNVDQNPNLCIKYAISNIPTMILFKNGKNVEKLVGLHSKEQLQQKIDNL